MDEEELEQPNKININSFFQSVQSVDRVAKSALNSSETSLKSSRSNLDLIKAYNQVLHHSEMKLNR